jgi:hypothetical protein
MNGNFTNKLRISQWKDDKWIYDSSPCDSWALNSGEKQWQVITCNWKNITWEKQFDMEHMKEVGNWLIKCVHKRAAGNEAAMINKASKTEVGEKSQEGRDVYTC